MNKSISISVFLISNVIMLGPLTNMNFFSNAVPIEFEYNQYMNNDISEGYSSDAFNNYRAILDGHQLQRSIFDKYYGCNNNDHKYTTTDAKILHQTGQIKSSFERTAVGSCAKELVQSSPIWVDENNAMKSTGQPSAVSNLTKAVITTNTYFVWVDGVAPSDILFKASSASPAQNLSANAGSSGSPQIASSPEGNNVYVVWQDDTPGNSDIFFAASTDKGQTFSASKNLSNNTGASTSPQISSSGNNVYVVWRDDTPGNSDIFFAASTDNGQTFSYAKNLSNNPGASTSPQISSSENNVYVVWRDDTPGNSDIVFAASTDKGQTFSDAKNLSTNAGASTSPQISSSGDNVYVVWRDDTPGNLDIFFAASTDKGQTFSTSKNLSSNPGLSTSPQISSSGNNVYVVWRDDTPGNIDIFFAASTDNGQTFSTPENLSNNTGASTSPQISSSGNNVYVVWRDDTPAPGNLDIFFAGSTDNGQTFSTPQNLSNNTGASTSPQISSSGNNSVYVVWQDDTPGNIDIFFAASTDKGQTFSTPENLSTNAGASTSPQIPSSRNNSVYVVWQDIISSTNIDIFFAASTDNGQTFSDAKNLSNNTGASTSPQISSSGNNVYVAWHDDTPGNSDIFFAASTDKGQTFSASKNFSTNAGAGTDLHISSSGNNVYVVWPEKISNSNFDIFFVASTDNGQTFSTVKNLSSHSGLSLSPEISSSGSKVYVVWHDNISPTNSDIFFAASTDNGQTFSTVKNVSPNTGESGPPAISLSGNNIYVVWEDDPPGNSDIFFAASTDNGQTFSDAKNLSPTRSLSFQQISSSGNNVYVVWQDDTPGNSDIFFAASTDNGQTFSTPDNLSSNPVESRAQQISSSGNNVYVVWQDNISSTNIDIFFAASTDNGQTFSVKNLSSNAAKSTLSRISSSGDNVYVVWQDSTPGNSGIFFALSTDNGQTFSATKNVSPNTAASSDAQISIGK